MGAWHPPPRAVTRARSAVNAACVGASSTAARADSVSVSPARVSTATMPCPGAGRQASASIGIETRSPRPSRSSPATASTSRSWSPASSLRSRVPTLPRTRPNSARGHARRNCATRRTLPLPTRGAAPPSGPFPTADSVDGGATPAGSTTASRGSARGRTAAIASPAGSSAGMSLALCTARSMSPRTSACSISLTKTRLPPTCDRLASRSRSPVVVMTTSSHSRPLRARTRAATALACQSARSLPRVPSLSRFTRPPGSSATRTVPAPRRSRRRGRRSPSRRGRNRFRPDRRAGSRPRRTGSRSRRRRPT